MHQFKLLGVGTLLLALAACDSDGTTESSTAIAPLATALPAESLTPLTIQTNGAQLEQVVVDEVTQPAPGIKEYKLSTIVCGGTGLLMDQQMTVSYPGGTAVAASAPMGMSGFNQCRINAGNKFRVQLPEAESFDPAKLQVTINANQQTNSAPVRLIKVDLYRVAGRASHQELIALNTLYPVAGEQVTIRAALGGNIKSPTFALIAEDGTTLQQDKLNAEIDGANGGSFQVGITVPSKPFRIAISANDGEGEASRWVTDTYVPQPKPIEIDFSENAVMDSNTRQLNPHLIGTANYDGQITFRLVAPRGFSTNWNLKTIETKAGDKIDIPITLTSTTESNSGKFRILLQHKNQNSGEAIVFAKFIKLSGGVK
jgi:hypothetical protein